MVLSDFMTKTSAFFNIRSLPQHVLVTHQSLNTDFLSLPFVELKLDVEEQKMSQKNKLIGTMAYRDGD